MVGWSYRAFAHAIEPRSLTAWATTHRLNMRSLGFAFSGDAPLPTLRAHRPNAGGASIADLSDTSGGVTRSALRGSTRPAPNCGLTPLVPRFFAVDIRMARISSGVRDGRCATSSAATPDTWAVATEVPVVSWIELFGAGTSTSTPGAATEMYLPWLAPLNRRSWSSVAVTAITLGSAPGNSGGDFGPALPAAPIRMMPFSRAICSACESVGSRGPAKQIGRA